MMVNLPAEPPRQPSTLLPAPAADASWPEAEDDCPMDGDEPAEPAGCCAEGSLDGDCVVELGDWVDGEVVDGEVGLDDDGDWAEGSVVGELDEGELCATAQLTETSRIKVNSKVLRMLQIASKES
jgi:hypothetical protein